MTGPAGFRPPRCAREALMAERDRHASARHGADEGFLQRWSRRKAEARSADETATADPSVAAEGRPAALEQTPEPAQGEPVPVAPEDLPDIESLDASSDFSVFMRPGVPEHLRTQALRKLWRSDPIFSKLDGLLEYGEDYTIPSWPKGAIRTAYQIGRGFVNEFEKLAEAGDKPAPSEEPAAEPASEPGPAVTSAGPVSPAVIPAEPPAAPSGSDHTRGSAPVAANPVKRQPRPLPRRG
jgi:Protein of unknown function (DUF3306)